MSTQTPVSSTRTDREMIENKLVTIRRTVGCVGALGAVGARRLADQPSIGLVIERDLWLLMDQARSLDSAIAVMLGDRSSRPFEASVRAGVIDQALAHRIEPDVAPHHVLLQLCLDTEPEAVAGVVAEAVSAFAEFADRFTDWVTNGATDVTATAPSDHKQSPTTPAV